MLGNTGTKPISDLADLAAVDAVAPNTAMRSMLDIARDLWGRGFSIIPLDAPDPGNPDADPKKPTLTGGRHADGQREPAAPELPGDALPGVPDFLGKSGGTRPPVLIPLVYPTAFLREFLTFSRNFTTPFHEGDPDEHEHSPFPALAQKSKGPPALGPARR